MEQICHRTNGRHRSAVRRRGAPPRHGRQRGAFAVMTVFLVMVMLVFCGFAIDLGRMYNRKVELQTIADTIAFAAAKELDGTTAGVTRAVNAAAQAAATRYYNYSSVVQWSESAVQFGASPDGDTWLDAATAGQAANASTMFYARVDTNSLDPAHGDVEMFLLHLLPSGASSRHISSVATAGRVSTNAMPLAICAMSEIAGDSRGTLNELVEYGFRRGVSYNLMKLNPTGDAKGANYLINPVALPGQGGSSVSGRTDVVGPFVCTGTLGIPVAVGGRVKFEEDFPLASVVEHLNSRFGTTDTCVASSAPPDTNVKQYKYNAEFTAMDKPPTEQSAETRTLDSRMLTIADVPLNRMSDVTPATTGGMYGPLWVYSRAVVKDSRYVSGSPEPANGYTKFGTGSWQTLYGPDQQVKAGRTYPSTPYTLSTEAPAVPGVALRRILHVPLLRCSAPLGASGTAEVRAVAKFFMTVKATDEALYAEFAGLVPSSSLVRQVRLYP
jgi:Flp pilus assembly protein TadG